MTDTNYSIDAILSANQFLKQVYLVFGKDYGAWRAQGTLLIWHDYMDTQRTDIANFWRTYPLEGYVRYRKYVDDEYMFTDKFVQEIVC